VWAAGAAGGVPESLSDAVPPPEFEFAPKTERRKSTPLPRICPPFQELPVPYLYTRPPGPGINKMLGSTAPGAHTQMPPQGQRPQQQQSNGGTSNRHSSTSMSPATKREGTAVSSLHSLTDDDDDDDDDDEHDSDYRGGDGQPGAHGSDGKPTRKRKRKGLGNWTRTTLACVRCRKMKIRVSLPFGGTCGRCAKSSSATMRGRAAIASAGRTNASPRRQRPARLK
jgi:hypothetical protein